MNVERKREFVQRHTTELERMEEELRFTCPHANVVREEIKQSLPTRIDFYNDTTHYVKYRVVCTVCGLEVIR